jgi:F-type H+-transporting ATPase subunit epsilon
MKNFKLNLYTPNGVIVKGLDCSDVLIPTVRGQVNVLTDHTHFLTQLDTGILTARNGDKTTQYTVTAGVCKVLKDEITILSYTSETDEKIDPERAKLALEKAEVKLSGKEVLTELELQKYQRKLQRANMRIQLVKELSRRKTP